MSTPLRILAPLLLGSIALLGAEADGMPDFSPLPPGIKAEPVIDGRPVAAEPGSGDPARFGCSPSGAAPPVLRLEVGVPPAEAGTARLTWPSRRPLAKGATLLMRLLARALRPQPETDLGSITAFGADRATTRWFAWPGFPVPRAWTVLERPVVCPADFAAGRAEFGITYGAVAQELEVARFEVLDCGVGTPPESLPRTASSYQGREPDAPWRAAAAERIERLRKGDLRIRVVDRAGHPVAGAAVHARMTRHAFAFGSEILFYALLRPEPEYARYREMIRSCFNSVTLSGPDWRGWDKPGAEARQEHRRSVLAALQWCDDNHLPVIGHNLVWPGEGGNRWRYLPDDIIALAKAGDGAELARRVDARIDDVTAAFRGRFSRWVAVNEAVDNHLLQNVLGPDAVAGWFRRARSGDPATPLIYNDYCMLSGFPTRERNDRLFALVRGLLDAGAPVAELGEQAHFGEAGIGIDRMLATLDRFAALGLPIRITEFDMSSPDARLQADYLRDFYTAAFSHPAVCGITMWGFWEERHWKPAAALWDRGWNIRPNGEAYMDLVFKRWWTDERLATDAAGTCSLRGFCGTYRIDAGDRGGATVELGRDGAAAVIELEP